MILEKWRDRSTFAIDLWLDKCQVERFLQEVKVAKLNGELHTAARFGTGQCRTKGSDYLQRRPLVQQR
jgi:hypothetical protein